MGGGAGTAADRTARAPEAAVDPSEAGAPVMKVALA